MSDVPRHAVERVLARAAELQAASEVEPGDTISEARLLEIAREVGLDPAHVQQAIAEQRAQHLAGTSAGAAGDGSTEGALLRALGPAFVGAQRAVPGTPLAVLDRLEPFLAQRELLTLVRRTTDRGWWEPRRGPLGNLLQSLGIGGRRYDFVRSDQLVATVTRLDDARCVLRLDTHWHAARRTARANALAVPVTFVLVLTAAAIPLMALGLVIPPFAFLTLALLLVLAIGVSGWHWRATQRRYRAMIERARIRVEALLDDAEHERMQLPRGVVERLLGG